VTVHEPVIHRLHATVPDKWSRHAAPIRLIVPIESPVPAQAPTMPLAGVVVKEGALGERDEHAARNEQAREVATGVRIFSILTWLRWSELGSAAAG
jgi:hypothetical protein